MVTRQAPVSAEIEKNQSGSPCPLNQRQRAGKRHTIILALMPITCWMALRNPTVRKLWIATAISDVTAQDSAANKTEIASKAVR
jgi:hypothetical protein